MDLVTLSFLLVLPSVDTTAQPGPLPQELTQTIDCGEGGSNQSEMNVCAERAAFAVGVRLDGLLEELRGVLEAASWDGLGRLQVQWAKHVKEDCAWERSFFAPGSAAPMIYSRCMKNRTEERIARLKIFLCEGAGMTGPCDASRKYDVR